MQILSAASSLNPGQDLWVIAEPSRSRWPLQLDWYLNFQLDRAEQHSSASRPEGLTSLLKEVEWNLPEASVSPESTLLVSSEGHLPARWLAQVNGSEGLEEWVKSIHKLWAGLGKPSFRVFLPAGVESAAFGKVWKKQSTFEDFSVVLDSLP